MITVIVQYYIITKKNA